MMLLAMPVSSRAQAIASGAPDSGDPDRLYAEREDLAKALEAASIWDHRLGADPKNFDAAWKRARAGYWLGAHVSRAEQRREYERGVDAARQAVGIDGDRPEGHFWMAANMGALAESFGLLTGLKYRGAIKRELETVLSIDPSFQAGSADRALGRWYLKVPALFGGSKTKSLEHLERSLTFDADSIASHFFLAETLLAMDRDDDARAALLAVLDAPLEPDFIPESREFKRKAEALLDQDPARQGR